MSQIYHQGRTFYLGCFSSDIDAAVAYDKASLYLRGRDTELNFELSNYLDASGGIIEDPIIRSRLATSGLRRQVVFEHEIFNMMFLL